MYSDKSVCRGLPSMEVGYELVKSYSTWIQAKIDRKQMINMGHN